MQHKEIKPHVTVIDAARHKAFLHEQRVDPVTKEPFRAGDRVVICAADRSAFLEDSWLAIGGRHCGQTQTLAGIPVVEEARPFRRPSSLTDEPLIDYEDDRENERELGFDEDFAATHEPYQENGSEDTEAAAPRAIKLKEIPITLREIPFRLREIIEL